MKFVVTKTVDQPDVQAMIINQIRASASRKSFFCPFE
jgi:hypothetical protein